MFVDSIRDYSDYIVLGCRKFEGHRGCYEKVVIHQHASTKACWGGTPHEQTVLAVAESTLGQLAPFASIQSTSSS
jgi:hypothetical protein